MVGVINMLLLGLNVVLQGIQMICSVINKLHLWPTAIGWGLVYIAVKELAPDIVFIPLVILAVGLTVWNFYRIFTGKATKTEEEAS